MKNKNKNLIIALLVLFCAAAFGRISGNDFVNYDDNVYLTENLHVQSGFNFQTVKWAFSSAGVGNWHPLTMLSHMLDWQLFGAHAAGHHLMSLFFHIGAVIFLFLFLSKTTRALWPSAFAAAFFALHPLRVESVAWASERKDVLSMFFGMASLYAYAFYAESRKRSKYVLCLLLFALSLMSKPMLVTLPFVLLLLDVWPLKRADLASPPATLLKTAGGLIREKIPFFVLTILISVVTVWAQIKEGSVAPVESVSPVMRLFNSIYSYAAYLGKLFWPADLAVFYPYDFSPPSWKIILSAFILLFITAAALRYARKLPFLIIGWFWYLGTLIPVIGFVQVGRQAMADRYTYLPSIGIAVMLAWGFHALMAKEESRRKILAPAAAAVVCIFAFLAFHQCGYWKSSYTLFRHTLKATQNNYLAYTNLGAAFTEIGGYQYQRVIQEFDKALRIKPDDPLIYYNRALAYAQIGQYQKAISDYDTAIRLKPDYLEALNNRGLIYGRYRQFQLAIADFNRIISINPSFEKAYNNRGLAYREIGEDKKAFEDFTQAIRLKPDYAEAYKNRASLYLEKGMPLPGCADAAKACALGYCKTLEEARGKGLCR